MGDKQNAQTFGKRQIVQSFDREFARLHLRSCRILNKTTDNILYQSATSGLTLPSVGESILRCAAAIEQTFGGLTANLWDDPFEWTLPEHLSTIAKVVDHLVEVEATRQRAFGSFKDDPCLVQHVATPSGETQPLIELLLATLVRATNYQGQAIVTLKLSGIHSSGFII